MGALAARVAGPLEPFAHGFLAWLLEQGYSPSVVGVRVRLVVKLSAWMEVGGVSPRGLTPQLMEQFLAPERAFCGGQQWCSSTSVRQLLDYLRGLRVVPEAPAPVISDPVELLVVRFAEFLVRERGIVDVSTVRRYQQAARRFLSGLVAASSAGLEGLTTAQVTGFVLGECSRRGNMHCRKTVVPGLRGLLRFLYLEGLTGSDLTAGVPSVACWRGASLPRALPIEDVRAMLACCDRRTPVGRRDFAILMVLARLGVRAGEVAALELSDVDWRAGEVVIRGKGNRYERLPLPSDVGEALVDYLRHGRPDREDRHLFLRALAPYGPTTRHAIGELVRSACGRAGLASVGVHRLRHTVATETLRAGASLEEIASLLRHRSTASTVIYAKVDFVRLRELARPWPGGAS